MFKIVLILVSFYLSFSEISASTKSFDKQKATLEAVKNFCLTKREDFCSRENLGYMFWNRPDDYIELMKSRQEIDRRKQLQSIKKNYKSVRDYVNLVIKELFNQLNQQF